ncbi:hypothetical protein [Treponema sp.]|uniref:hypothetical protein n=1 Tax=Treponema sp. TaxID=166 RepID=UPI003F011F48
MCIDSTLLSALVSALISGIVSFVVTKLSNKNEKRNRLDSQLDEIIKISIQYPYFELRSFTDAWKQNSAEKDEKYAAYEQYATLVFNYLEKFSKFYKYDTKKIESELGMKSWVRIHKEYWRNPTVSNENTDLYEKEFVDIIENMLR